MKRVRPAEEETCLQPKVVCRMSEMNNIVTALARTDAGDNEKVVEQHVMEMHAEFGRRRKITLSGLPPDSTEETVNEAAHGLEYTIVSTPKDGSVKLLFPDVTQAKSAIQQLNGLKYGNSRTSASFGHPDSLLFVGNLPFTYNNCQLRDLFSSCGETLRSFVVYSVTTGKSKGYGFVEFRTRDEALAAKQKMATKIVGLRSLRVDFADNGMQTCDDLQSRTLFVDKLPKGMSDNERLREEFSRYGTVNFCQVALTAAGTPRGFAFVDMNTAEEAEDAQIHLNGFCLSGYDIRVSFGMPCRPGACILQPRHTHPLTPWLHQSAITSTTSSSTSSSSSWIPSVSLVGVVLPDHSTPTPLQALVSVPSTNHPASSSSMTTTSLNPLMLSNFSSSSSLPLMVSPADSDKENRFITTRPEIIKVGSFIGHKRRHARTDLTIVTDEEDVEEEEEGGCVSAYDKPYLGQHQQGIPFTHPLKRIRMQ